MTTNGLTPPLVDRQRRRAEAIAAVMGRFEAERMTTREAVGIAFDLGLLERRVIQAEAERDALARLAAKDDGTRPPSRPKGAVEYSVELGGESGGA